MTFPLRPYRLKPGCTINIWYDDGCDYIRQDEPSARGGGWFPCTVVKVAGAVDHIQLHVRHWDGATERLEIKLRELASSVQHLTQDDKSNNDDDDDDDSIAAAPWRNVLTGSIAYLPRPHNLSLGDLVWSNFQNDGTYFRGRIAKVHPNDTFDVGYDDSDYETNIPRQRIIQAVTATSSAFGQRHQWLLDLPVHIQFGQLPAGTVTAVHDDGTVDITYKTAGKKKKVIKRDFDVVVHQVFADAMAKYGTVPVAAPSVATKKRAPINSTKAAATAPANNSKSTLSKKVTTKGSAAGKKKGSSTTPTSVSTKPTAAAQAAAPVQQRPAGVTSTEQTVKADSIENFSDDQTAHDAVTGNNGTLLPGIAQPESDFVMPSNGLLSADANVRQRRAPPESSFRLHLKKESVSNKHNENAAPASDHTSMMLLPNQATQLMQILASSDGPVAVAHLQQLSRTSRRHLPTPELWQHFFNVLVDGPTTDRNIHFPDRAQVASTQLLVYEHYGIWSNEALRNNVLLQVGGAVQLWQRGLDRLALDNSSDSAGMVYMFDGDATRGTVAALERVAESMVVKASCASLLDHLLQVELGQQEIGKTMTTPDLHNALEHGGVLQHLAHQQHGSQDALKRMVKAYVHLSTMFSSVMGARHWPLDEINSSGAAAARLLQHHLDAAMTSLVRLVQKLAAVYCVEARKSIRDLAQLLYHSWEGKLQDLDLPPPDDQEMVEFCTEYKWQFLCLLDGDLLAGVGLLLAEHWGLLQRYKRLLAMPTIPKGTMVSYRVKPQPSADELAFLATWTDAIELAVNRDNVSKSVAADGAIVASNVNITEAVQDRAAQTHGEDSEPAGTGILGAPAEKPGGDGTETLVDLQAPTERPGGDGTVTFVDLHAISATSPQDNKSLEELRVVDYAQCNCGSSTTTTARDATGHGLFDNSTPAPSSEMFEQQAPASESAANMKQATGVLLGQKAAPELTQEGLGNNKEQSQGRGSDDGSGSTSTTTALGTNGGGEYHLENTVVADHQSSFVTRPAVPDSATAAFPSAYVPKLTKTYYHVQPPLSDLAALTEADLAAVEHFSIERPGYGKIEWEGAVDVRGADLDRSIVIDHLSVSVYTEEEKTGTMPEEGCKLNRPAKLTFYNAFPNIGGTDASDEAKDKFARQLQDESKQLGADFILYDKHTGVFVVRLLHFSR